jgi:hypothetical protein
MVQLNDKNTVCVYLQFHVLNMQLSECGIQTSICQLYLDLCWIHYADQEIDSRCLYPTVRQPNIKHVETFNVLYIVQVWLQNHNDTLYFNNVILLYPLCLNILIYAF